MGFVIAVFEIVRTDGKLRHLEAFSNKVQWDGKTQTQITYQDITERKQIEDQLRHSQILMADERVLQIVKHLADDPNTGTLGLWPSARC